MEQVERERSQTRLNESLALLADEQREREISLRRHEAEAHIQKMKIYSQIIEVLKVKISTKKQFWLFYEVTQIGQASYLFIKYTLVTFFFKFKNIKKKF